MNYEAGMIKHGDKLGLKWVGDILVGEVHGAYNEEGITGVFTDIKESVLKSGLSSWYRIEIWNDAIGSPEVVELLSEMYTWCKEHGCLATAAVITNRVQEKIIEERLPNIVEVFGDKEQAMAWLKAQRT